MLCVPLCSPCLRGFLFLKLIGPDSKWWKQECAYRLFTHEHLNIKLPISFKKIFNTELDCPF